MISIKNTLVSEDLLEQEWFATLTHVAIAVWQEMAAHHLTKMN